jgi:hypothetical protein
MFGLLSKVHFFFVIRSFCTLEEVNCPMSRSKVAEGRLPLSLSPDSSCTPQRGSSKIPDDVKTLCAALRRVQEREKELVVCMQDTLGKMRISSGTPPHAMSAHRVSSSSSPGLLTVDAKAVWMGSRSSRNSVASSTTRCDECEELRTTVVSLRLENEALCQRQRRLEAEMAQLRLHLNSQSPRIECACGTTPTRRIDLSNVLLRDSTQKLLAEAERQLQLQEMSRLSAC